MWIFFGLFFILWILVTIFLPIKDMIEARFSNVPDNSGEETVKNEQTEKDINET